MSDLNFQITSVQAVPYAAVPTLAFKLHINQGESAESRIHSVILRCQIRIEPTRRRYTSQEQKDLNELFGEPSRWGQTVRSMLWTNVTLSIPGFTGSTDIDLPVACTYDFNVATTKYFYALTAGEIPVAFLFSGTVFYEDESGSLQVSQISWEREAATKLPVETWRLMMDCYYPNTAWITLRKDLYDRLQQLKAHRMQPSFERLIESLLDEAESTTPEAVVP